MIEQVNPRVSVELSFFTEEYETVEYVDGVNLKGIVTFEELLEVYERFGNKLDVFVSKETQEQIDKDPEYQKWQLEEDRLEPKELLSRIFGFKYVKDAEEQLKENKTNE